MNNIFLVNGPIKKFVHQVCKCVNSSCVNKTEFGKATEIELDKFNVPITTSFDVCSKCGTPYEVQIDTSNIVVIKNIGDFDEEKRET